MNSTALCRDGFRFWKGSIFFRYGYPGRGLFPLAAITHSRGTLPWEASAIAVEGAGYRRPNTRCKKIVHI